MPDKIRQRFLPSPLITTGAIVLHDKGKFIRVMNNLKSGVVTGISKKSEIRCRAMQCNDLDYGIQ